MPRTKTGLGGALRRAVRRLRESAGACADGAAAPAAAAEAAAEVEARSRRGSESATNHLRTRADTGGAAGLRCRRPAHHGADAGHTHPPPTRAPVEAPVDGVAPDEAAVDEEELPLCRGEPRRGSGEEALAGEGAEAGAGRAEGVRGEGALEGGGQGAEDGAALRRGNMRKRGERSGAEAGRGCRGWVGGARGGERRLYSHLFQAEEGLPAGGVGEDETDLRVGEGEAEDAVLGRGQLLCRAGGHGQQGDVGRRRQNGNRIEGGAGAESGARGGAGRRARRGVCRVGWRPRTWPGGRRGGRAG